MALTPKQENFCLAYLETGNASEAYRRVYKSQSMKPETVNRTAKAMLDNHKIAARLAELREPILKRHATTVDDLIRELEEARQLALSMAASAPAVSATMGKARILGMDRQVIDHKIQVVDDGSSQW